ncbi:uncharacterized protein LOC123651719 isoform X2 [Pipistrellus kuhlii]|uniref:uncharacterized protein LOC123651719 isoform X2 n=1 Tax=Pipistrellus kuhlii TaxID=59472 RepID=UPI001E27285D|nr:uncharacterized protein LOC123651719 isoform X2 [Pipistrellus kuhlii]
MPGSASCVARVAFWEVRHASVAKHAGKCGSVDACVPEGASCVVLRGMLGSVSGFGGEVDRKCNCLGGGTRREVRLGERGARREVCPGPHWGLCVGRTGLRGPEEVEGGGGMAEPTAERMERAARGTEAVRGREPGCGDIKSLSSRIWVRPYTSRCHWFSDDEIRKLDASPAEEAEDPPGEQGQDTPCEGQLCSRLSRAPTWTRS